MVGIPRAYKRWAWHEEQLAPGPFHQISVPPSTWLKWVPTERVALAQDKACLLCNYTRLALFRTRSFAFKPSPKEYLGVTVCHCRELGSPRETELHSQAQHRTWKRTK